MSHADVTKWAKVCCQHLHSSDAEAPQNRFFTVEYDRKKLQEAVDSGEAAIEPLIRDFIRVAATVEMAREGYAYRLRAIGHLFEAEDESQEWPELHAAVREVRSRYQAAEEMPDWNAMEMMLTGVRQKVRQAST